MIGKTLGHYKVTGRIGAGGMGVVCKARDLHLDSFVALKIPPPEKVSGSDRKRRFVQAATAASALHHPNVIRICHVHRSEGTDSTTQQHYAFEAAAQPIGDRGLSHPEMSWRRPYV
jgi:serine/threonine protein kinase